MIPIEIIKKIRKLHIKSGRTVNSMMAGQYRSVFRGSGIEFEEVREYSPGDDVKSIDWKVSARVGRPFIKLYREEREMVVMLLIDMSASANFGTTENTKKDIAAEVSAILSFNAIRNNDKVGAIFFTDQVEKFIPPQKGNSHIWRVIKEIYTFRPQNKKTDLQCAIRYLSQVCRKHTTSFIISDFLAQHYQHLLKISAKKHEFIGVILSDPGDFNLPNYGIVTVEDLETGNRFQLDAANKSNRNFFSQIKRKEYFSSIESLKTSGIDTIQISTADSVTDALIRYFHLREKRIH